METAWAHVQQYPGRIPQWATLDPRLAKISYRTHRIGKNIWRFHLLWDLMEKIMINTGKKMVMNDDMGVS